VKAGVSPLLLEGGKAPSEEPEIKTSSCLERWKATSGGAGSGRLHGFPSVQPPSVLRREAEFRLLAFSLFT